MAPPTKFSDALAAEICQRVAEGECLAAVCRDPKMPSKRAVTKWLTQPERQTFHEMYAAAREGKGAKRRKAAPSSDVAKPYSPTPHERSAMASHLARRKERKSAPRMNVTEKKGVVVEFPVPGRVVIG